MLDETRGLAVEAMQQTVPAEACT